MNIPRIYLPVALNSGSRVLLEGNAFNHVIRVLRLKVGAPLILFNGNGGEFLAVLKMIERRQAWVQVQVFRSRELESALKVTLVQGISRGERMDYTLQKAVELGVDAVQPLRTIRSVVNLSEERLYKRLRHWRLVVAGACEQCGRNQLPAVLEPREFHNWLADYRRQGLALLLDPLAGQGLRDLSTPSGAITLLVGPEGGLSHEEIQHVITVGFTPIRLGPRVLRTETAGIAVLTALQTLWGDLG